MRLFRRRTKNNRGFSLVEMICAIAVLGLTSTAIGSAMVVSTQNYQRGNAEVDVQKEAQTTTNLIGNLLVDAVHVNKTNDASGMTIALQILGESITYDLTYDPATGKINYKETKSDGTVATGVLAENVSDFRVDDSAFSTSRNVQVELSVDKNGKDYDATYNTTARNGAAVNVGAAETAVIICETDLVLEPGQTYDFPIAVYGMSSSAAGITWSGISPVSAGAEVGTSQLQNSDENGTKIYVSPDARGTLSFVVKTKDKEGTTVPLDTKTVTVRVRRANSIPYEKQILSGNDLMDGCVYRIYADVNGDNMDKVIGKAFDDGTVLAANEYKNPRYVKFTPTAYGGANFVELGRQEDIDRPYIDIQLVGDMPAGSKINVTMLAKHPEASVDGVCYNKTGTDYDQVVGICPINKGSVWNDAGIKRGNDNMFFESILDPATIKSKFGGEPRWYYRYREKTTGALWTQYYRTMENGTEKKFNAAETRLWLPNKGYEIDMILMSISGIGTTTPKLEYPQDPLLLTELQSYWPELQQGWTADELTDADKAPYVATTFSQYGGRMEIAATKMMYDVSGTWQEQYGDDTNPGIVLTKDTSEVNIDCNTTNLTRGHYNYSYRVYKKDASLGWVDVTSGFSTHYVNIQFDNSVFKFNGVVKNGDGTVKNTGYFKLVPIVVGEYMSIASTSRIDTGIVCQSEGNGSWELGYSSGLGCVYFEIR